MPSSTSMSSNPTVSFAGLISPIAPSLFQLPVDMVVKAHLIDLATASRSAGFWAATGTASATATATIAATNLE